jgi:hypothetical protein
MLGQAILVAGMGALLVGCASQPRNPQPSPTVVTTSTAPAYVFTAQHAALVRSYYEDAHHGRGRGNAGLPPGIAKNLARGKPLPPGIAKQYMPNDLLIRLPAPPVGLEYVIVAGKLLLVEAATQVVRQVLLEAVFG